MKVINLEKVSKAKRLDIMHDYCKGPFTRQESMDIGGVGIGGLKYVDGANVIDDIKRKATLRANTELLKNGLGIYLRDEEGNYMLLISFDEILTITFTKEMDTLTDKVGFSFFKSCLKRNMPYHYSKMMLLDDEIIQLNPPMLKIVTHNLDEVNFEVSRKNPFKVRDFFKQSVFHEKFEEDYHTFKFQNR